MSSCHKPDLMHEIFHLDNNFHLATQTGGLWVHLSHLIFSADLKVILSTPSTTYSFKYLYLISTCSVQVVVVMYLLSHKYSTYFVNSYHEWKLNRNFHASQQLNHEHYLLNSLRQSYPLRPLSLTV